VRQDGDETGVPVPLESSAWALIKGILLSVRLSTRVM
jgi:hypothetical protein